MRDVLDQVLAWYRQGTRFALATVVRTRGSSPREPGATMAVAETGAVAGSLSGGCVEGAVVELAGEVLATSRPAVESYGVSDDEAFGVGLTCGGVLEVLVRPVDAAGFPELPGVAAAIAAGRPVAVATTVAGGPVGARLVVGPDGVSGTLGDPGWDRGAADAVAGMLHRGETGMLRRGPGECAEGVPEVFVEAYAPPPRMLVFGAVDFAAAVTRVGRFLGYHVTLCDARAVFATRERFPQAHEVVVDWPHRYLATVAGEVDGRTAVCVLTHDPKFDVPLLEVALRTPAGYVGAMGSRRTHLDRLRRLREAGLGEAELARLRSPIGLDLGARSPEETAVSIAAEIVAARYGGTGRPLHGAGVPIHRPLRPAAPTAPVADRPHTLF